MEATMEGESEDEPAMKMCVGGSSGDSTTGDSTVGDSSGGSVFGDYDCNDNAPAIIPHVEAKNKQLHHEELSPTKKCGITSSPLRTSSRCSNVSNMSDQQNTNTTYSPEDTINNDFFYDDEFSVPFDANLGELDQQTGVDVGMLDAVDINALLTLSKVGTDDNRHYIDRLSSSKSDSCLYATDMGFSTGSDRVDTSIEQSISDPDLGSSSELSDLRSEPLFSPPPGSFASDANIQELSTDSLGRSGVFSSSLASGDCKYSYDWTANRDQYMLSFVAPSRASDDDSSSYHDSLPSDARESLSSWTLRSSQSLSSSCNSSGRWTGFPRMTGSGRMTGSHGSHKVCDSPLAGSPCRTPLTGSPKHNPTLKNRSPLTTWATKKEKVTTTWARMKEGKEVAKIEKGMTSWKDLKSAKKQIREEGGKTRSKSMSDIESQQKEATVKAQEPVEEEEEKPHEMEVRGQPEGQADETPCPQNKRYSTSLLELFQRLKSQCGEEEAQQMEKLIFSPEPEVDVSSSALQMLTGTWSMSPCSEKSQWSQVHTSSSGSLGSGMVSWSALKNSLKESSHEVDSLCNSVGRDSLHLSQTEKLNSEKLKLSKGINVGQRLQCSFGCNTSMLELLHASAQAGSDLLTLSKVFGCNKRDVGVQFPPNVKDCCIQTSLEEDNICKIPSGVRNQSQQTGDILDTAVKQSDQQTTWKDLTRKPQASMFSQDSPKKQVSSQQGQAGNVSLKQRLVEDLERTASKENLMVCSVDQGLKRSKEKESLTGSDIFHPLSALPDLSFLNNNMTSSAIFEEFLYGGSGGEKMDFLNDPLFAFPDLSFKSPVTGDAKELIKTVDTNKPPPKPPRLHGRTMSLDRKSETEHKPLSRESSPVTIRLKSQLNVRSRHDSTSTNSMCSSTSSGIDPGSCDSGGNQSTPYFTKVSKFNPPTTDCNSQTSESEPDVERKPCFRSLREKRKGHVKLGLRSLTRPDGPNIKPSKSEPNNVSGSPLKKAEINKQVLENEVTSKEATTVKEVAKTKSSASNAGKVKSRIPVLMSRGKPMAQSHPKFARPGYVKTGDLKSVDYLQVSPTHIPVKNKRDCCRPVANEEKSGTESGKPSVIPVMRNDPSRKPLKSCLVKRRKGGNRNRHLFKHRSYSDPHDLTVMKYSQEGQTKYQLITSPSGTKECPHGLNVAQKTATAEDKKKAAPTASLASQNLVEDQVDSTPEVKLKTTTTGAGLCVTNPQQQKTTRSVPVIPEATASPPDIIPAIPCPCQSGYSDTSATSAGSPETSPCTETCQHRTKKSVSFCEEIYYHSPSNSPRGSPKKQVRSPLIRRENLPQCSLEDVPEPASSTPRLPVSGCSSLGQLAGNVDLDGETPPLDFTVSPSSSADDQILAANGVMVDAARKRDLILEIIRGAEVILTHFSNTRDPNEKAQIASTTHSPEVGHLLLKHLCPAVHALLLDGLKPQVRSLFGKIKNSSWKVIEDSAELGPSTRIVHELVQDLKAFDFLSTNWLRFNAFIFGLLNRKALDFWLTYLQSNDSLLQRHYLPGSFLLLSTTSARHLFVDMTTALQPLAQLPFRLEYDFEYRHIREHQQRHVAEYVLDKHISHSLESSQEGKPHSLIRVSRSAQDIAASQASSMDGFVPHLEQTGPSVGRQTREMLESGSKKLLGKLQGHTNVLSFDSLQTILGGRSGRNQSSSAHVVGVPQLQGINDQSPGEDDTISACGVVLKDVKELEGGQNFVGPTSLPSNQANLKNARPQSVAIVKNNEILEADMEDSINAEQPTGFLNKVAQQIKELTSPEKGPVYKRGVTEYQFDGEREGRMVRTVSRSGGLSQELANAINVGHGSASQSYTDSGIDIYKPETPPVEFTIPTRQRVSRVDPRKRWSDSSAMRNLNLTGSPAEVGMREVKKRWSSFGPSLINMFDKLLLDNGQGAESRIPSSVNGSAATTPSSSGIDSPRTPSISRDNSQDFKSLNTSRKRNSGTFYQRLSREDSGNVTSTDSLHSRTSESYRDSRLENLQEVQALCHHIASDDQQLSFEKGDLLKVIKTVDTDWLLCNYGNNTGLVHAACVKGMINSPSVDRLVQ